MSHALWKFSLEVQEEAQEIEIPMMGIIRRVETQGRYICMWVEVDPEIIAEKRRFKTIGTGRAFDENSWKYVGMTQMGSLVWHVLEERDGVGGQPGRIGTMLEQGE